MRKFITVGTALLLLGACNIEKSPSEPKIFQNIVQMGKMEARKLNVPTANIAIDGDLNPGVYSCKVIVDENWHNAMCYHDKKRPSILETHIFDYNGNLYGKKITVKLCNFIRAPCNFKSFQEAVVNSNLKVHQMAE